MTQKSDQNGPKSTPYAHVGGAQNGTAGIVPAAIYSYRKANNSCIIRMAGTRDSQSWDATAAIITTAANHDNCYRRPDQLT